MNLTDAIQATVANIDESAALRAPETFSPAAAGTFCIQHQDDAAFSIHMVPHSSQSCDEICARLIDSLSSTDLCETFDLKDFDQAVVDYRFGKVIRSDSGLPCGWIMYFSLDTVPAEQCHASQKAA